MEYRETFVVKGKYGMHTGPAEKISWIAMQYQLHCEEGFEIDFEIIKKSCPEEKEIGEKANASSPLEIISLLGLEGSELEVTATLKPDNSLKEADLKNAVKDIGKIIVNLDKHCIRPH